MKYISHCDRDSESLLCLLFYYDMIYTVVVDIFQKKIK